MPGVLMIEGMAQLAGLLVEASLKSQHGRDAKAILTVLERTKFRAMVRPGDSLVYRAEMMSVNPEGGKATVRATRDGRVVATTAMVFAFKYIDDPLLDSRRTALLKMWMEPS
jgi:3-hydroxyacyl-[acyl-carrier-protein] dehydratase